MSIQAVILAGGLGTRLGSLTADTPKPMLIVNGKPFLEWLVMLLIQHQIRRFVFLVGFLSDQIERHFEGGANWNCHIEYSFEDRPLGTGGALKLAGNLLDDTFLLLNGDNFLALDYEDLLRRYRAASSPLGMITCVRHPGVGHKNNILLSPDHSTITTYDYDNPGNKDHMDCGTKIFSRKLLSFFDDREVFSLEADVMSRLATAKLLKPYLVSRPPLDIGTPENLEIAKSELLRQIIDVQAEL